ncbi:MAG: hypothetical protein U1E10_10135 [Bdellovibrionales bacterium]|nr:hypothetical protein [Bdellovibrionales bacterium]
MKMKAMFLATFAAALVPAISQAEVNEIKPVPAVKDAKHQYEVSIRDTPCPAAPVAPGTKPAAAASNPANKPLPITKTLTACGYDYVLVASALDNGEHVWERVLYSRAYNLEKEIDKQIIRPTSLKIVKKKSAHIKNERGDEFVVWLEKGYLTKPASPKTYPTDK